MKLSLEMTVLVNMETKKSWGKKCKNCAAPGLNNRHLNLSNRITDHSWLQKAIKEPCSHAERILESQM